MGPGLRFIFLKLFFWYPRKARPLTAQEFLNGLFFQKYGTFFGHGTASQTQNRSLLLAHEYK
jgi:hypothetical protein